MTDADLAALCAASYVSPPTWQVADVRAVRTAEVVAFPGTDPGCVADWLRDLDAVPVWRDGVGYCHRGFLDGALLVLPWLRGLPPGLTLTGHSMGGAIAILAAALLRAADVPVAGVVTFGAPRAGGAVVKHLLADIPVRQFRHAGDPVPDVPCLPGVLEHVRPLTEISVGSLDPLADHAVGGYVAALAPVEVAA